MSQLFRYLRYDTLLENLGDPNGQVLAHVALWGKTDSRVSVKQVFGWNQAGFSIEMRRCLARSVVNILHLRREEGDQARQKLSPRKVMVGNILVENSAVVSKLLPGTVQIRNCHVPIYEEMAYSVGRADAFMYSPPQRIC